ncbi:MAG: 4-(cytidine 5'-diphospho)-2-C-methyl-D-erythritol kinase [Ruminiclostridium sp.]
MNLKTTVKAYAKLNLFLDITGRYPNGYHELCTVMQQIDLHDDVEINVTDGKGITVSCDNPLVPCDERNIAYKAAKAFLERLGRDYAVEISIKKRIPLEGGMGGSSTDGAAVLTGLNRLFDSPFSAEQLYETGNRLGADIPFCIHGGTALCKGTGNIFTQVKPLPHCTSAIIQPDFTNNTGIAYAAYDKAPVPPNSGIDKMLEGIENSDIKMIAKACYNVFERLYGDKRIEAIRTELLALGAMGASMTGSGSAVFGIFENEKKAENALKFLNYPFGIIAKPINNP